jgi:hypothetical protein
MFLESSGELGGQMNIEMGFSCVESHHRHQIYRPSKLRGSSGQPVTALCNYMQLLEHPNKKLHVWMQRELQNAHFRAFLGFIISLDLTKLWFYSLKSDLFWVLQQLHICNPGLTRKFSMQGQAVMVHMLGLYIRCLWVTELIVLSFWIKEMFNLGLIFMNTHQFLFLMKHQEWRRDFIKKIFEVFISSVDISYQLEVSFL